MQMAIFKDPRPGIEADATIPVGVNQQSQPERMDRQSVCWLGSHSTTARALSKIRGVLGLASRGEGLPSHIGNRRTLRVQKRGGSRS